MGLHLFHPVKKHPRGCFKTVNSLEFGLDEVSFNAQKNSESKVNEEISKRTFTHWK
jgi:hypothetical protein